MITLVLMKQTLLLATSPLSTTHDRWSTEFSQGTKPIAHGWHTLELGNQVGVGTCSLFYSHLREQVNNVRMVVSPLWRGPGNVHGFVLDGKSYRQGEATAQTPTVTAVSGVRITTSI